MSDILVGSSVTLDQITVDDPQGNPEISQLHSRGREAVEDSQLSRGLNPGCG